MKTIEFPIPESMLKTLKRDKCEVRRIGKFLYEVKNQREKFYIVKLSPTDSGFAYTCVERDKGIPCESMNWDVNCRHAYSAGMVCRARNEALKGVVATQQEAA